MFNQNLLYSHIVALDVLSILIQPDITPYNTPYHQEGGKHACQSVEYFQGISTMVI